MITLKPRSCTTSLIRFASPSYIDEDGDLDLKRYKKKVKGLNEIYWALSFKLGGTAELDTWTIDKVMEAYAAMEIFNEREAEQCK